MSCAAGWLRFKLCPVNSFSREATPRCLDQHPVQLARESVNRRLADGQWDRYKHYLQDSVQGRFMVKVIIPSDISCDLCVLQWEYKTGRTVRLVDGELQNAITQKNKSLL